MNEILNAETENAWESGKSFTLRHRMHRLIWNICWLLLASWTPAPLHRWRRLLLAAFGANVAPTAVVYPSARVWYPPNLEMGEFACLAPRVNCYNMGKITLGSYAIVSQGAHLCAGTHDISDPNFQLLSKPIVVDDQAWIAADAFVGPGVFVARGAVLGARGVAFKNLDAWSVYAGNPATFIKKRIIRDSVGANGPIGSKLMSSNI